MARLGKIRPATLWRVFFVFCVLSAVVRAAAPNRPPELAQVGKPTAAEARQILERFRLSGISGRYYLQFELRSLPRRGPETVFSGRWWGGRNDRGAITRVELVDAAGAPRRFLVQNGERPALWRLTGGQVVQVGLAAAFEPLFPSIEITAFDLQMPFLYWPNATLESVTRIRGRPAYAYVFRAPAESIAQRPEVAAARGFLDTQYNALMQTELFGPKGEVLKTMALLDLKKIVDPKKGGEQWIPKSFDLRNEITRDKTRFIVTGAALDLDLSDAVFEPAALAEAVQPPVAARIVRIP